MRKEQGRAVNEALDEMATEREQIEEQVVGRLERAVRKALADELETVGGGLAQAGQRVLEHDSATESRREELARAIGEVEERIGPMQAGVQEVKRAAEKVGLEWT